MTTGPGKDLLTNTSRSYSVEKEDYGPNIEQNAAAG
jgi:hypothetical protein